MKITITIEGDLNELEKLLNDEPEETVDEDSFSEYARFFDEDSPVWTKDVEHNQMFLKYQENYANEKLRACGYLFLNEVYEMLGIPKTAAGQRAGWVYCGEDRDVVRFNTLGANDNGMMINFNPRGNILSYL